MAKNKKASKPAKSTKAVKAPKVDKVTAVQAAAAATCAENAVKTAQPGIIAEIMSTLVDAKKKGVMITASDILTHLSTKFPERAATGMMITVRAQLSRLPKEKDFQIDRTKDGRVTRYSAA